MFRKLISKVVEFVSAIPFRKLNLFLISPVILITAVGNQSSTNLFLMLLLSIIPGTFGWLFLYAILDDDFPTFFSGAIVGYLSLIVMSSAHLGVNERLFFFIVALLWLPFFFVYLHKTIRRKKAEAEERRKIEERNHLLEQIKSLTGNDNLAGGFLTEIEKLTQYVPDEGIALLQAVIADYEEYKILNSYIGSTTNDVLRADASRRRDEILSASRELCAKLTEEALHAVREHESLDSARILSTDRPRIANASEHFGKYLEGLREVRENLSEADLSNQITGLVQSPEPQKISAGKSAGRSGIRN